MHCLLRLVLCFGLLVFSCWSTAGINLPAALPQEIFLRCTFSVETPTHLVLKEDSGGSRNRPTCFLEFGLPHAISPELGVSILIMGIEIFKGDRFSYGNGFVQGSSGDWHFQGTELLLSPKILKTSFTEERNGDETLLVGHQLIKGNIAQGGPISVPGIRILRITQKFVVSVDLNFQPLHYEKQNKGYRQLREAVSRELVDIVRSVQITPGVPGPTVRSNYAP